MDQIVVARDTGTHTLLRVSRWGRFVAEVSAPDQLAGVGVDLAGLQEEPPGRQRP